MDSFVAMTSCHSFLDLTTKLCHFVRKIKTKRGMRSHLVFRTVLF